MSNEIVNMNNKPVVPISVLIPTMNRLSTVKKTLETLLAANVIPAQIVIVDQSMDSEVQKEIYNITAICNKITSCQYFYQATPSLTKARNQAIRMATQELVVFSDDDVDVYADTLQNIMVLMKDSSLAMIAGINDNSTKSKTNIGYILGTKSFINRKVGHVTLSMLGRYPDRIIGNVPTQWAMGYFFVVRKSLLDIWNISWDEKLTSYAYAEDLDFSFNYYKLCKQNKLHCILSDKVRVKHLGSQEYRIPLKKTTYMYVLHRVYLSNKHRMGWKSRLAIGWCDFWRLIERICKRQAIGDLYGAIHYCRKNRKKVKEGNFFYG